MKTIIFISVFTLFTFISSNVASQKLWEKGVNLRGYNIHFTSPQKLEMEMIASSRANIIRMDFNWEKTEKERGIYDFSEYDILLAALEKYQIKAVFILDYKNILYDNNLSPYTDLGRVAFSKWAIAAVRHFKGKGIIWEMYNEPNGFWTPATNIDDYIELAIMVGKNIKSEMPDEIHIGPACSNIDFELLEKCFSRGLLNYWDAVSVHPYRLGYVPETVSADYARLRELINKYAPSKKQIPIISSEWGYPSAKGIMNVMEQSKLLVRQWLVNWANEIPVSIWYDWQDDGKNSEEHEHNFGIVYHPYQKDSIYPYIPKLAYKAAKTFNHLLSGFTFCHRIALSSEEDYCYVFRKEKSVKIVLWSLSVGKKKTIIPFLKGSFGVTSHLGEELSIISAGRDGLCITLEDAPLYLTPAQENHFLTFLSSCAPLPMDFIQSIADEQNVEIKYRNYSKYRATITSLVNNERIDLPPNKETVMYLPVSIDKNEISIPFKVKSTDVGNEFDETCKLLFIGTSFKPIQILSPLNEEIFISISNPLDSCLKGEVYLQKPASEMKKIFTLSEEKRTALFPFSFPQKKTSAFQIKAGIESLGNKSKGSFITTVKMYPVKTVGKNLKNDSLISCWKLVPDGDMNIGGKQVLEMGKERIYITYQFEKGWKFLHLTPKDTLIAKINGTPSSVGMWIYPDETECMLALRFKDITGQIFQVEYSRLKNEINGWVYLFAPLDGSRGFSWGGAGDGKVHYPIIWQSILLIDGKKKYVPQSVMYIDTPMLIYE